MENTDDGTLRKQEADYTAEVDEALPKAVAMASVCAHPLTLLPRRLLETHAHNFLNISNKRQNFSRAK